MGVLYHVRRAARCGSTFWKFDFRKENGPMDQGQLKSEDGLLVRHANVARRPGRGDDSQASGERSIEHQRLNTGRGVDRPDHSPRTR